jgi:hypothetical protein
MPKTKLKEVIEMRYTIICRETGTVIEEESTYAAAEKTLKEYEETDKKEGTYTPDFYEIVEKKRERGDNGQSTIQQMDNRSS